MSKNNSPTNPYRHISPNKHTNTYKDTKRIYDPASGSYKNTPNNNPPNNNPPNNNPTNNNPYLDNLPSYTSTTSKLMEQCNNISNRLSSFNEPKLSVPYTNDYTGNTSFQNKDCMYTNVKQLNQCIDAISASNNSYLSYSKLLEEQSRDYFDTKKDIIVLRQKNIDLTDRNIKLNSENAKLNDENTSLFKDNEKFINEYKFLSEDNKLLTKEKMYIEEEKIATEEKCDILEKEIKLLKIEKNIQSFQNLTLRLLNHSEIQKEEDARSETSISEKNSFSPHKSLFNEFKLKENRSKENRSNESRSNESNKSNKKIKFDICEFSYNDDEIKEKIQSLKTVADVVNLEPLWLNIRHNEKLQKLYKLIPSLKKLNSMIGLDNVKNNILKKIIYYIQNPHNNEYLHTVFIGPPGVGKTELSKIYGEIFKNLGILKNNKFIEVKRTDLVGKYLGHTAIKTKEKLEEAIGGVLFLDEAYSMGNADKTDTYSKESIDTINQFLSERKNEFMMIIAGYETELENCFFSYNPGLKRRFASYYRIEGYKADELYEIFIVMIKEAEYEIDFSKEKLKEFVERNYSKFKYYAGDVRKLVDEIKYTQGLRIFYENTDSRVVKFDDVEKALENLKSYNDDDSNKYLNMYI